MIAWKYTPHIIKIKMPCVVRKGNRYKRHNKIIEDLGDIPVFEFTPNGLGEIVNNRGNAYACRNRMKYRNKKAYNRKKV